MVDKTGKSLFRIVLPPVLFIATISLVATDVYLPSFPAIVRNFKTSNTLVQLSFALYLLFLGVSQLAYGAFSERFGRKKTSMTGLSLGLIGTLVCIFSPAIGFLILGRMLQGIGFGAGAGIWRAILRDVFKGSELAHINSFIAIGTAIMMAVAPLIGGFIQDYLGWRYSFVFIFLYTLIGIGFFWRALPETLLERNPHAIKLSIILRNMGQLLSASPFMGYALCGALCFSGVLVYLAASPFLLQNIIGLTPVQYGWMACVIALALALGGFLNAFFVKKIGHHNMNLYGIGLMLAGSFFMLVLSIEWINILVILLPIFVFVTGVGISVGNCSAAALHHFPKLVGFAGGLYGAIQILVGSIGTSIMAALHEQSQVPLSIVLICIGIGCWISQKIGFRGHKKLEK